MGHMARDLKAPIVDAKERGVAANTKSAIVAPPMSLCISKRSLFICCVLPNENVTTEGGSLYKYRNGI